MFDSDVMIGMIRIDLQKVFDTIDHGILSQKVISYWFLETYFSNRPFLVNLGHNFS